MTPTIRHETAADHPAVHRVHRLAFGQDDEANLVDALRAGGHARVSLVAEAEGSVVGHVLFTDLPILTDNGTVPALSLAPLAVLPECQRTGVGSALARAGLAACRDQGHRIVVVLGHPAYYPRFGFSAALAAPLLSPFGGREAWMAAELVPGALAGVAGWVRYAPPFGAGVQVRPMYRPDRGEWLRLRAALWPDAGDTTEDTVFVAERPDGRLCGFVEASLRSHADGCDLGPIGYVEGWYVDPDARRQGVGRKLVQAAEAWAAERGCREMASDAHLPNTVSHAAHLAIGYEESDRLVHFRKPLAPTSRSTASLTLLHVAGTFAVCKLPAGAALPPWATAGDFFAVTRTADEVSVVCPQSAVPDGVVAERDWRCLRVAGAMPFTLVGVLASLTAPLARAGVSVFAVSTFDTDYLLVKAADLATAVAALRAAGHRVVPPAPVRLRDIGRDDLPWMYQMHLDPEANRLAATTPRTAEAFAAHWAAILAAPGVPPKAILLGDVPVGYISCFQSDGRDNVGYWVGREHWGQGIASRALELLLLEFPTRPLYAQVATANVASLRVLQKAGFVVERVQFAPATERYTACEEATLVLLTPPPSPPPAPG